MNRNIGIVALVVLTFVLGVLAGRLSKPLSLTDDAGQPLKQAERQPSEQAGGSSETAVQPSELAAETPPVKPEPVKPVPTVQGNLLADGGFEDAYPQIDQHGNPFAQWGGWKWEGECTRDVDRNIRHGGKSSALLIGKDACMVAFNQKVTAEPGFYRLSGYVRAAGLGAGKWGKGMVFAFEGDGLSAEQQAIPMGTYGWRKFDLVTKFPQAGPVMLYTYMYGPGRVWLDDLSLVKLPGEDLKEGITVAASEEKLTEYAGADGVKCMGCGKLVAPGTDLCPVCGVSNKALAEAAVKAAKAKADAAAAAAAAPEKLLTDGGFEDLLPNPDQYGNAFTAWSGWKWEGICDRGADTTVKRSGKASAWLSGQGGACMIGFNQRLTTKAGYYKLTGYVRAQNVVPGKWNRGVVIALEPEGGEAVNDPLPEGTYEWRKFERIYKFDKAYSPNLLYIYMYGSGKAWLDDLSIEKLQGEGLKEGLVLGDPEGKAEAAVPAAAVAEPVATGPAAEPAAQPMPDGSKGVRLWQYSRGQTQEYFNYGLNIVAPWADGGHLLINFPEHLEYMPGTRGILRYSDRGAKGHWVVSADGMTAKMDAESVTEPGVFVQGEARVVSRERVEITMKIVNKTERLTLGSIRPLYCFQYRHLTGFAQWVGNLDHTFFVQGGKLVPVSQIKTKSADTKIKAGSAIGSPQQNDSPFAAGGGGWIEEGVDASLVAVSSLDNQRNLIFGWIPGKSAFTNANIPCVHADPYYGSIEPGKSAEAKAVIVFTTEPMEKVVKALRDEGVGAPVKQP